MNFSDPAVAEVFALYEERRREEQARSEVPGTQRRRDDLLLSVGPEAGWFLHSLILARRPARILELGTSYGYSTLFLADAAKQVGGRVVTMELADYKQAEAARLIGQAGLADTVDFRLGDAVELVRADAGPFDLVLLDIWKDLYLPCLQAVYPKLSDEGIIAADNMIHPPGVRAEARRYRRAVAALPDMQSALLPVGQGIELSVRWAADNPKL